MENARDVQSSASPVDTTGIDELFDVTDSVVEVVTVGDKIEVPVTEAASKLGVSKRTMWRRIKAGEFGSRFDGRQTLVTIPASLDSDVTSADGTPDTKGMPRHIRVPEDELTQMKSELERTKIELLAVTNRAQYLQGQVDLYQEHFKLLVDRQNSSSWWRRFMSWFAGSDR